MLCRSIFKDTYKEEEAGHCLGSGGHTRIMPMTGNIAGFNSCGDFVNARGIDWGGLGADWEKGYKGGV